jgi:hypothetical protein
MEEMEEGTDAILNNRKGHQERNVLLTPLGLPQKYLCNSIKQTKHLAKKSKQNKIKIISTVF